MNESIPSNAQPPHAARNPRIWSPVGRSLTRTGTGVAFIGLLGVGLEGVMLRTPLYQVSAQDGIDFHFGKRSTSDSAGRNIFEVQPINRQKRPNFHFLGRKRPQALVSSRYCSTWNNIERIGGPTAPSHHRLSTRHQFRPIGYRACRKALTMLISTLPNHQVRSHAWEQAACG